MKKLILFILLLPSLCFGGSIQDAHKAVVARKNAISDPCVAMGASGTYDLWWNGEYSGDTDKACTDSGATPVDATDVTAGVIHADGAIGGSYGALLNAADEHIRYTATSETIDNAGTVQFDVTVPASTTGNTQIFEIFTDNDNFIIGYYDSTDSKIKIRHEGNNSAVFERVRAGLTDGNTYTIIFSWRTTGTERTAVKVDAGAWAHTDQDLTPFAGTVDYYAIGDDQRGLVSIADSWKVDNFQIREGYEGD